MAKQFSSLLAIALLSSASAASAAVISFDFTDLGANNTLLPNSIVVGGVTADGFISGGGGSVPLWLRNEPNDHGLGVCSEGEEACSSGGGDVNELSNQENDEIIRLTRPDDTIWTSLWVSSLDGSEQGRLFWSNDPNGAAFNFLFEAGDFGALVEGDVLSLVAAAGFDPTAKYLFFVPNFFDGGEDNDYLVWKGTYETIDTPEPGMLGLLGLGLAGLALGRRRRG